MNPDDIKYTQKIHKMRPEAVTLALENQTMSSESRCNECGVNYN